MLKNPIKKDAYINGKWVAGSNRFPVYNPYNNALICDVTDCDETLAGQAIQAAHDAFPRWATMLAAERAVILGKWADEIAKNQDNLAALMTLEQGKPLSEALTEVKGGVEAIRWAVQAALRLAGDILPPFKKDTQIQLRHEPVGVCVSITPWNFPVGMVTRKVAPAIAAGCTMVLKPAEDTPLCALALADMAERAGMPPGVFNVVPCARDRVAALGEYLCTHPLVRKISFTGSTKVGKILSGQAGPHLKRMSLELGGNAPFIIFASADLDKAADGLISSKFRNAGQTCICANRIFVEQVIFDKFLAILKTKVGALVVGDGAQPSTQIGPLINQAALEKVSGFVKDAVTEGAKILLGGTAQDKSLFYQPTILAGISPDSDLNQTEIFGPVAVLTSFGTESDAIAFANDTEYGLAAYFYSQDAHQIERVASQLDYGMVGVNEALLSHASIPFGGRKNSGYGREGGPDCLDPFLDTKYVLLGV